jgi:5'-deoxynucleotidase YfbR-like HD superfamily hydrolase
MNAASCILSDSPDRFRRQIEFILEIDRLKEVYRQSHILHADRHENSAEHSWHLAIAALLLAEYANQPVDTSRVIRMALVHDLVEIDAGDTFIYDTAGNLEKAAKEEKAAERIFGLLPSDQRDAWQGLWKELEQLETVEAKFANALDRLLPVLHNYFTNGRSWKEHGITQQQALEKNAVIAEGSETIWILVETLIRDALQTPGAPPSPRLVRGER